MKRSRWNRKTKKWKDDHSGRKHQKANAKRHKTKQGCCRYFNKRKLFRENNKTIVVVPKRFSLIENTEETMSFFMDFVSLIQERMYRTEFYIDSRSVEYATVDALIYLIAILQNDSVNIEMKYRYSGNFPKNADARKVYQESGFTSYVQSKIKELPHNTEKMKIVSGAKNDANVSKQFCEFVMQKLHKERREVAALYVIFIELMSNVYHHAYNNNFIAKRWYMYAEHIDDHVRFVFVDTGMGIAKTVRKNFKEKIESLVKINDGDLLKSTFKGDFRTRTNEIYRGNGLSTVREKVLVGMFENFQVISGSGKCIIGSQIKSEEHLKSVNYHNKIYGTVYTFDFY